jgi:hypothetical protein
MSTIRLGGRTPYSLAWRSGDGTLRFTAMTVLASSDHKRARAAIMEHPTLADWATFKCDDEPIMVALGGVSYSLRRGAA